MRLRLTRRAHNDIAAILEFLAEEQQRPEIALKILESIERIFVHIQTMPSIGRASFRPETKEISIPHLPFTIVYRVSDDFVEILTVFHDAQNPDKKLQ